MITLVTNTLLTLQTSNLLMDDGTQKALRPRREPSRRSALPVDVAAGVLRGGVCASVSRQPSAESRYLLRSAWNSRLGERPVSPSKDGPRSDA